MGIFAIHDICPDELDIDIIDDDCDGIDFDDPAVLMDLQLKNQIKIIDNNLIKGIKIVNITSQSVILSDPRLENSRIPILYKSFLKFLQNAEKFNIKNGEIISPCRYATDRQGYFHVITSKHKNFNCLKCVN